MARAAAEGLVDRIYEAAVVPERWSGVLDDLSSIGEGDGALILTRNAFQERWLGTGGAKELFEAGVAKGWQGAKNPRAPRLFAARHAGFLNDLDVFTREEIDQEPYFTEYLRPLGFGWGTATAIEVPSGDMIAFDVERRFERGPVERSIIRKLDKLRPHLARASLISSRLMFERARTVAETLGLIGLPAAVLGVGGRPLAANTLFEAIMPHMAHESRGRLILNDSSADRLFADAFQRLASDTRADDVRSIPLAAREERPPMILHVVPIRGAAHDVFSGASAILVVTPVEPRKVPTADVLQGLFDLTPAEARVARTIAEGKTIEAFATAQGLSAETVRTQLKSTLAKTGVHRQAELAALLGGLRL